jgi:hypothetical protein
LWVNPKSVALTADNQYDSATDDNGYQEQMAVDRVDDEEGEEESEEEDEEEESAEITELANRVLKRPGAKRPRTV